MRYLSFIIIIFAFLSFSRAQSPHGQDFDYDCSDCHTTDEWRVILKEVTFDHGQTGFELLGQHSAIDCGNCHESLVFSEAPDQCYRCHTDLHENTLGKECQNCHTSDSWVVDKITEIHQMGRFPLLGNHITADCNQCHISSSGLRYEPIGVECYDCHGDDYNATQNPNHLTSGFSTDCQSCHDINAQAWSLASFAHDFFPLTGAHALPNCFSCHTDGNFTGLSTDCVSCHRDDYNSAVNPNHLNLGFPLECTQCHNAEPGWQIFQFLIHDQYFELLGAHASISGDCASCHQGDYSSPPPNFCFGCHEADYNNVKEPPHAQLNFSTDCEECHSQSGWLPSEFDHDAQYFPIFTGKHTGSWNACSDCHTNPTNYQIFSCISCHEHNQTDMDKEHEGINGYLYQSQACFDCHPTGEGGTGFNHSTTLFPLTGSHIGLDCTQCHSNGFQGNSTECFYCHEENYNSAPDHLTVNYPSNCEGCHTTNVWLEVIFDHSQTNFQLTGSHINNDCNQCHTEKLSGTSAICVDCHLSDYQNAINPNHQGLSISAECEICHTTSEGWQPAVYPDHDNIYALIGAHSAISSNCAECHNGNYNTTPNTCYGCHSNDYNATSNPPHQSSGFSTECETCHSQTSWVPSTFDHDAQYFPIYSGKHDNEWNQCSDCHTNPSNYSVFSCITCHEHNQTDMDDKHSDVTGYIYQSEACLDCHPDGNEDKFKHGIRERVE